MTALVYGLFKQIKPEYSFVVLLAGAAVVLAACLDGVGAVMQGADSLLSRAGIASANVKILMKSAALCIITQLTADLCRDSSASALAGAVELAGKAGALITAMPLIKTVAGLALGLID